MLWYIGFRVLGCVAIHNGRYYYCFSEMDMCYSTKNVVCMKAWFFVSFLVKSHSLCSMESAIE